MSKTYNQLTAGLSAKDCYGDIVTIKGSGCGVCSVASIAYNVDKDYSLETIWKYMVGKGYTYTEGSTRDGISKAIEHYGMHIVKYVTPAYEGSNFKILMDSIAKTGYGILLFHASGRGGKTKFWTKFGHYVSITDYKDGKFYVRDSANGKTGWHPRARFEGDIFAGWSINVPLPKPVTADKKETTPVKVEVPKTEVIKTSNPTTAKCCAKKGVNIRNSKGKLIGHKVPYNKKVSVIKKSADKFKINGVRYTMCRIKYGTITGYVAQTYFKF